jgi:hypothetical protein
MLEIGEFGKSPTGPTLVFGFSLIHTTPSRARYDPPHPLRRRRALDLRANKQMRGPCQQLPDPHECRAQERAGTRPCPRPCRWRKKTIKRDRKNGYEETKMSEERIVAALKKMDERISVSSFSGSGFSPSPSGFAFSFSNFWRIFSPSSTTRLR